MVHLTKLKCKKIYVYGLFYNSNKCVSGYDSYYSSARTNHPVHDFISDAKLMLELSQDDRNNIILDKLSGTLCEDYEKYNVKRTSI